MVERSGKMATGVLRTTIQGQGPKRQHRSSCCVAGSLRISPHALFFPSLLSPPPSPYPRDPPRLILPPPLSQSGQPNLPNK